MKTRSKIARREGVRGAAPVIAGTRITVTDIVRYYRMYLPELVAQILEPPDPAVGCVVSMEAIVKECRPPRPQLAWCLTTGRARVSPGPHGEVENELQE